MKGPEGLAALAVRAQFWLLGGVFLAAALIEAWRPERSRLLPRTWRWGTNLGLYFLTDRLFRVIVPYSLAISLLAVIGGPHVEAFASIDRWGGPWTVFVASFLMLDLATYLIHRLEHALFPLWRLHAVHHADIDVDASTAVRHHPIEAILNGIVVLAFMLVLRMPLWALPTYAVIAVAVQVAQHANLKLPARLERSLGRTDDARPPSNASRFAARILWDEFRHCALRVGPVFLPRWLGRSRTGILRASASPRSRPSATLALTGLCSCPLSFGGHRALSVAGRGGRTKANMTV